MLLHHEPSRDPGRTVERAPRLFERLAGSFEGRPSNLGLGSSDGLKAAGAALQQRADANTVLRCLRFGRDCAVGVFELAQPPPGLASFSVDGVAIELARRGPTHQSHAGYWCTAFFTAVLLRNEELTGWLATYPKSILAASETRSPAYAAPWVDALSGMRLDADGWQDRLLEAIELAEREQDAAEYANLIALPAMRLVWAVYREPERFNERLHDALIAHQHHRTTGDRSRDPMGFFALAPTAIASWAYDGSAEFTVESDYLPRWLVEGAFERE